MSSTYLKQDWLPQKWAPHYCEALLDDYEGFRILARGEALAAPMFRIRFDSVIAHCSVEEASCFNDERRAPGLVGEGYCFLVEDSWYLRNLHVISSGVRVGDNIHHFAVYLTNRITDVISYGWPDIENLGE